MYKEHLSCVRVTLLPWKISWVSACILALIIRHSNRVRRITLSSVACLSLSLCLPYYLIKGTIFIKDLLNTKYVS